MGRPGGVKMPSVREAKCATCGAPVVWLGSYGFGDPRPVDPARLTHHELVPGDVIVDAEAATYRYPLPGEPGSSRRHRLHWPCADGPEPGVAPPRPDSRPVPVGVVAHVHWDREWYETFEG